MNEQQFGNKMNKDGTEIKKAFGTLVGDGVSQLKDKFAHISGAVKENVDETTSTIKEQVGIGLEKYNTKAQEVAENLPGGITKSIKKYPWVVVSLVLIFGFILGILIKPSRQTM